MRRLTGLLVVLAVWCACPAARADRSRLADEADVVEPGDCEAEWGIERQRPRGAPAQRETTLQLGCGVGWRSELALVLGRLRGRDERESKLGVAVRTALIERRRGEFGWTLDYGFERSRAAGQRWRSSEAFVAVEVARQVGADWLVDARLGTQRDLIERRGHTLWAVGFERSLIGESLELRAAVGRERDARPVAEVGLRALVWGDDVALTLTLGSGAGPPRQRRAGVALSVEF